MFKIQNRTTYFETNRDKIREKKNKTAEEVAEQVKQLHEWIVTQAHLPDEVTSEGLEFFLTNYDYNIKDTHKAINAYFKIRSLMPDIFLKENPTSEDFGKTHAGVTVAPLPKLTNDLKRVCFLRVDDMDPEHFSMAKSTAMLCFHPYEVQMFEDLSCGHVVVADYKHLKLDHVTKINMYHLKRCAFIMENLWGNSSKECHFINFPEHATTIVNDCGTSFFGQPQDLLFVHDSLEELYKYITKEILPVEYGGNEKSLDELNVDWQKKLDEYKPVFNEIEKLIGKPEYNPDLPENAAFKAYYEEHMKDLTDCA